MMFGSADFVNQVSLFFMNFLLVAVLIVALFFLGYLFFQWFWGLSIRFELNRD